MTVKSSISFTDRHRNYADQKVKEGTFASVSSVVAAGMERIMQEDAEREAALEAMKETIKRRMETPRSDWVEMDETDKMFANAKAHLQTRQT